MVMPVASTETTENSTICEATNELVLCSVTVLSAALGVAETNTLATRVAELASGAGVGVGLLELSWKYVM